MDVIPAGLWFRSPARIPSPAVEARPFEPGFPSQGLARLGPLGEKHQGYAVVAVALAGGLGAVIEDMALVAPTALAMVFGARNDQFEIHFRGDATG